MARRSKDIIVFTATSALLSLAIISAVGIMTTTQTVYAGVNKHLDHHKSYITVDGDYFTKTNCSTSDESPVQDKQIQHCNKDYREVTGDNLNQDTRERCEENSGEECKKYHPPSKKELPPPEEE